MTGGGPGLRGQERVRSGLQIGGAVALGIGLILTAIAFLDFVSAFGSFRQPTSFWLAFLGLPLIGIGSAMLKAGFLGPASRYVAGEVTPTLADTLGALGLGAPDRVCPSCGASNAADARFCDDCGTGLRAVCPSCGAENASDARFCDDCGAALELS